MQRLPLKPLFYIFLFISSLWSNELKLSQIDLSQSQSQHVESYGEYTLSDKDFREAKAFKWNPIDSNVRMASTDHYWTKLNILNDTDENFSGIVFTSGDIYQAKFYTVVNKDTTVVNAGAMSPYSQRVFKKSWRPMSPLKLSKGERGTVYIKISNDQTRKSTLYIGFQESESYYNEKLDTIKSDFTYLGSILILILFAGITYSLLKHSSLLFYILYLVFHTLSLWSLQGHLFTTFELENPMWVNYWALVGPQITFIFFFLFHQKFLSLSKHTPLLSMLIHVWVFSKIFIMIPLIIYFFHTDQHRFINTWIYEYHLVESLLTALMLLIIIFKKVPYALWTSFANGMGILGYICAMLFASPLGSGGIFSFMGFLTTGLLIEAILLFLGMIWQFSNNLKNQYSTFKLMNQELINHHSKNVELIYFVNHHLRRPVAHLLGLNSMLQSTGKEIDQSKIFEFMNEASTDIDLVVSRLNSALANDSFENKESMTTDPFLIIKDVLDRIHSINTNVKRLIEVNIESNRTNCIIHTEVYTFLFHFILYSAEQLKSTISLSLDQEDDNIFLRFEAKGLNNITHNFDTKEKSELLDSISKQNLNLFLCSQILEIHKIKFYRDTNHNSFSLLLPK